MLAYLYTELLNNVVDPVAHLRTMFVFWILLGISSKALLGEGLGLCLLLTVLEALHFSFNSFSGIDQVILVFDVSIANPTTNMEIILVCASFMSPFECWFRDSKHVLKHYHVLIWSL